ncbi:hypothetical protein BS17DRAFT_789894 [Gyrodon lividus]|nr:hypothetical protein BS17DRAFT_789894 [Gyrodon lividus]
MVWYPEGVRTPVELVTLVLTTCIAKTGESVGTTFKGDRNASLESDNRLTIWHRYCLSSSGVVKIGAECDHGCCADSPMQDNAPNTYVRPCSAPRTRWKNTR